MTLHIRDNCCFSDDDVDGGDDEDGGKERNPLLVDMVGKENRERRKTDMWFSKVAQ